jgi:hypothetical protein
MVGDVTYRNENDLFVGVIGSERKIMKMKNLAQNKDHI